MDIFGMRFFICNIFLIFFIAIIIAVKPLVFIIYTARCTFSSCPPGRFYAGIPASEIFTQGLCLQSAFRFANRRRYLLT